ncbi:alpha/beta-hydrolase [Trametopsis cervina]|nr:alpha/beta-hydrolase [Trametopsis cervina]
MFLKEKEDHSPEPQRTTGNHSSTAMSLKEKEDRSTEPERVELGGTPSSRALPIVVRILQWSLLVAAVLVFCGVPWSSNGLEFVISPEIKRAFERFAESLVTVPAVVHPTPIAPAVVKVHPTTNTNADANSGDFWSKIPVSSTSTGLKWKTCEGDKECARFEVPLDYLAEDIDGPKATIALLRIPARVPATHPSYGGPILFNPGGPGGSGVVFVSLVGNALQQVVGEQFDIVGFDPRGVGKTLPALRVFEDAAEGVAWRMKDLAAPLWNTTSDAMYQLYARTKVYNAIQAERGGHVTAYASTASVARDMLEINKAHGRDKLQYWGFSYGSVLGATFAAMFPNNVGRLIIDGVVNTRNYYETKWNDNLIDTDAEMSLYFQECVDAGQERCGLWEPSADKVEARYNKILSNLKRRPLAVPVNTTQFTSADYGIVDYTLVKAAVFTYLYSPYTPIPGAPNLASQLSFALGEVEKGNGAAFWDIVKNQLERLKCACSPSGEDYSPGYDPTIAIACGDGEAVTDSPEELEAFQEDLARNSSFADIFPWHARCSNWQVRPKYRFTGPFGGNTSFPLLIIGNTADPVTPLHGAQVVGKDFNGSSVVLTQNSAGHCSLAVPSPCTITAIRAYFQEGVLPEPGTVCETPAKMFGDASSLRLEELRVEERLMMKAAASLTRAYSLPDFGLAKGLGNF